jgi:hypothetical protein
MKHNRDGSHEKKKMLNVKPGGMYSNHWALKSQTETSTFK